MERKDEQRHRLPMRSHYMSTLHKADESDLKLQQHYHHFCSVSLVEVQETLEN